MLGGLLAFSVPALIGNLLHQVYSLTDSIVVGRILGMEALAARVAPLLAKSDADAIRAQLLAAGGELGGRVLLLDRFGKDITLRPIDEKHSELNVEVFISPQFFGWIFGLGKDVQIVGPDEVVEEMKERAKTVLEIMK